MNKAFVTLALVLAVALVLPIPAQATPFSALIVFGDSLSDNGNVYNATGGYPPPPYAQRFSNGPVAVEYLAASLGVPLTDYAFGGATTGTANYLNTVAPELGGSLPGMAQQFNQYVASLGGGMADPNALYFIWGGPNDVFNAQVLGQDPSAALTTAAQNIGGIASGLLSRGAQHVLVGGMPDLGLTPAFAANRAAGTALTNFYNGLLMSEFVSTPVMFWDAAAAQRAVIANPAAYGFTNVVDPCLNTSPLFLCGSTTSQQNLYAYWDGVHPTTHAHQLLAESIADAANSAVPEPASVLLLGTGLLLVARRAYRPAR